MKTVRRAPFTVTQRLIVVAIPHRRRIFQIATNTASSEVETKAYEDNVGISAELQNWPLVCQANGQRLREESF